MGALHRRSDAVSCYDRCPATSFSRYTMLYCQLSVDFCDLDVSVAVDPQPADRQAQLEVLKIFSQQLVAAGYFNVNFISTAVIPVVKCLDPYSGRPLDVSVNNSLALKNSWETIFRPMCAKAVLGQLHLYQIV